MTLRARILAVLLGLLAAPAVAQDPQTFLGFGDSITEGYGDDAGGGGYPQRLESLLAAEGVEAVVINEGIDGEKTPEGLTRLRGLLATTAADTVFLLEGSNDISTGISEETTLFNLEEMATAAEAAGLEAVQVTMVFRGGTTSADPYNILTGSLTAGIRDLAYESERRLVDPFDAFLARVDDVESLYFDAIHPNAEGYDLLASLFLDVVLGRDNVPPVEGRMDPARGDEDVDPTSSLSLEVFDFGEGVDLASVRLLVDGAVVEAEIEGDARRVGVLYEGGFPENARVAIGLQASDLALPANSVDRVLGRFDTTEAPDPDLEGDIDGDGRVDGDDLVLLALAFGSSRSERRFDARADLDGNGIVEGDDLAILASRFGTSL